MQKLFTCIHARLGSVPSAVAPCCLRMARDGEGAGRSSSVFVEKDGLHAWDFVGGDGYYQANVWLYLYISSRFSRVVMARV